MKKAGKVQVIVFKKEKSSIKYLLLRRIPSRGGFWQPITGRVEKNEDSLSAAKRELLEETGIDNYVRIIENVFEFILEGTTKKEIVYGVEVKSNTKIKMGENIYPEHDDIKWCEYEDAIKLLKWPQNKTALENLNTLITKK